MPVVCQTVDGVTQFTGTAGAGLFEFNTLKEIPRTTRVRVLNFSYSTEPGGDPGTLLEIYLRRPGGLNSERMLVGRADGASMTGPAGDGDVHICGVDIPREPGQFGTHWQIEFTTQGKTVDATACVDWVLVPYPDTNPRDAR